MNKEWDWCCERCGASAVTHFLGRDERGRRHWKNRCKRCGRVSEYLPTRAEIERECRRLRAAQGRVCFNDKQEKRWRKSKPSSADDIDDEPE